MKLKRDRLRQQVDKLTARALERWDAAELECGPTRSRDRRHALERVGTGFRAHPPADPGTTAQSVFTNLRRRAPDWTNQGVKLRSRVN